MKNTKRVWKNYQYRECDAFAAYLEKMALKGWHLKSVGLHLTFEKGEAKKMRYEVEVLKKASEYDVIPAPDTEEFAEYCTAAGWEFVCAYRKFSIFRTDDPKVVPIATDDRQRFEEIKSVEKLEKIASFVFAGTFALLFISQDFLKPRYLLSNLLLVMELLLASLAFYTFADLLEIFFWERNCKKKLDTGTAVFYKRRPLFLRLLVGGIMTALVLLFIWGILYEKEYSVLIRFACFFALIYIIRIITIRLKLTRRSAYLFFLVTYMIFSFSYSFVDTYLLDFTHEAPETVPSEVPLHIYELTGEETDKNFEQVLIHEFSKTLFGKQTRCWLSLDHEEGRSFLLKYEILESKHTWVLDRLWERETEYYSYSQENDTEKDRWSADAAVSNTDNGSTPEYILRYPKRIIVLHYDGVITQNAAKHIISLGLK